MGFRELPAWERRTPPTHDALQTPPGSPTSASDEALATEAAGGSRGAFAALVERHGARVLAAVERSVQDHHLARDLAQEVWIKVHRGLAGFDPARRFRPWLFAITCNHVRDAQRRGGRRSLHLLEDGPAPASVVAARPTTLLYLDRTYFQRLLAAVPPLRQYFERLSAERLADTRLDPEDDLRIEGADGDALVLI